jgi:hypothetical protein
MVSETIAAIVKDGKVTQRELVLGLAVIAAAAYIKSDE